MNTLRSFRLPGEIQFGFGVSDRVGEEARRFGGQNILLVTDKGLLAAGIADHVRSMLTSEGMNVTTYSSVSPNPRDTEVLEASDVATDTNADLIVVVGGGSPIDLAKAVAGIATNGGRPHDWTAPKTFPKPPIPIIAIPTTAGTGSEVTRSSVINDTERQIKISLRDPQIAPRVALVDPALTMSLPPHLTASTGMDALTHAIEAFTGRNASPITDALARQAMGMIARDLPTAVLEGDNRSAREHMMMASVIAGMAFSNSDVAAVHCIAEAIGGRYDTPHGVANSLFLPYLFAYNAEVEPARHADAAVALGLATANQSIDSAIDAASSFLFDLGDQIGIPSLQEIPGISQDDFPWIAAASVANLSNQSNARTMTETDYLTILDRAWAAT